MAYPIGTSPFEQRFTDCLDSTENVKLVGNIYENLVVNVLMALVAPRLYRAITDGWHLS